MKKILSLTFFSSFCAILLYVLFLDAEQQMLEKLHSQESQVVYAAFSFFFLGSDVLLPIPNSLIMILNGKVLGIYSGTLLSTVAGVVSSSIGFFLGRKSDRWLNRFFSSAEKEVSNRLFQRWGKGAVAVSKALPVLSESLSFVAGTTTMSFRTFLLYSLLGHCVVGLMYAYVGEVSRTIDSSFIPAAFTALAVLLVWLVQYATKRLHAPAPESK